MARTGEGERHELSAAPLDAFYSFYVFKVGARDDARVAAVYQDVTERKRAEERSRRAAEFDAFRVALGDALRPLSDPHKIRAEAMHVLGEHLRVDRVLYAEIEADDETVIIADNFVDGVPKLVGWIPLSDFSQSSERLRAGENLVISDVNSAAGLAEADRAAFNALGIVSTASVPLVKKGGWVANLSVHHATARAWTQDEIALVQETAERTWAAVERARAEVALRESEGRLQEALPIETVGVIFFGFEVRITDSNDAFARMNGYDRDELLDSLSW